MLALEFTSKEINLLKCYQALGSGYRGDFEEYMRYLLTRQYHLDVNKAIFNNAWLHRQIKDLVVGVESDGFDVAGLEQSARGVLKRYFALLAEVHDYYAALLPDLDCYDKVRTLGSLAFDNIIRACATGDRDMIRWEVQEFYESFQQFVIIKDMRRLIAV